MADLEAVGVGLGSASLGIQIIELGSQYISDFRGVSSDEKHIREFLKNMTATLDMLTPPEEGTGDVTAIPDANVNLKPRSDPPTLMDTCRRNLQASIADCTKGIKNLENNLGPVAKSQEPTEGNSPRSPETSYWNSRRFLQPFMKSKLRQLKSIVADARENVGLSLQTLHM
jgi:hypothetical protein